jgi:hypothetical protein
VVIPSCDSDKQRNSKSLNKSERSEQNKTGENMNSKKVEKMYDKIVHFNVKEGKNNEFKKWILDNEKEYAQSLPEGWEYLGCYYTVFHMGRRDWQIRYRIDSMAAYDRMRANENEKFDKLLSKIYEFIDPQILMEIEVIKSIEGLKILGESE